METVVISSFKLDQKGRTGEQHKSHTSSLFGNLLFLTIPTDELARIIQKAISFLGLTLSPQLDNRVACQQ
jgi:hypothetical protein